MNSLIDYILNYIHNYNKFNSKFNDFNDHSDYLLNYTYEDFLEEPKDIYGNKIETIIENNIGEYNTTYLEVLFKTHIQGSIYDNYDKYQKLLYDSKKLENSEDKTNEVYKNGIVYHICPKYVTENILKNGLRPKGGKNSKIYKNRVLHPKSVYVIYKNIDNSIKEYFTDEINSDKIHNEYDNKILKSDDVDIIKIDLNKYDRKLKFYQDTLGGNQFVFTREYIPPFCISLYKENPIKKFIKKLLN